MWYFIIIILAGAGVYLYLKNKKSGTTSIGTENIYTIEKTEDELRAEAKAAADANAERTAARLAEEAKAKARAKFTITAKRIGSQAQVSHPNGDIAGGDMRFQFFVPRQSTDKYGNIYDLSEWRDAGSVTATRNGGSVAYVFNVFDAARAVRVIASDGAMAEAAIAKKVNEG